MSAYWKIPLQVLVLMIGVLVFVFYLFNQPPMLFNPVHEARVKQSALAGRYAEAEQRFTRSVRDPARAPPVRSPAPTMPRRAPAPRRRSSRPTRRCAPCARTRPRSCRT